METLRARTRMLIDDWLVSVERFANNQSQLNDILLTAWTRDVYSEPLVILYLELGA